MSKNTIYLILAEHLPLEQGLRHTMRDTIIGISLLLAEHLPLEQGLRHPKQLRSNLAQPLAEHLPLEQGLRLMIPPNRRYPKQASQSIFH